MTENTYNFISKNPTRLFIPYIKDINVLAIFVHC
jgi:hypothetical protein